MDPLLWQTQNIQKVFHERCIELARSYLRGDIDIDTYNEDLQSANDKKNNLLNLVYDAEVEANQRAVRCG